MDWTKLVRYSFDALEDPVLPPLESPPEGEHHRPTDRVEEGHYGGYDRDGHGERVYVAAHGLSDELGAKFNRKIVASIGIYEGYT